MGAAHMRRGGHWGDLIGLQHELKDSGDARSGGSIKDAVRLKNRCKWLNFPASTSLQINTRHDQWIMCIGGMKLRESV